MTKRIIFLFTLLFAALPLAAREPIPQTKLWDLAKLGKAPEAEWGEKKELIQEVFFRGEPFEGKPTRVFAYVGRPEGEGSIPGYRVSARRRRAGIQRMGEPLGKTGIRRDLDGHRRKRSG